MRDKRKHPRYDVSDFPEFKAKTEKGPIGERLMTISIGGAGFWAPAEDFNFKIGQRVSIHVQIDGLSEEQVTLRGEVLYILPHPLEAQIGRFYGIRFSEEAHALVKNSLEQLHHLYEAGKVKMA